MRLWDVDVVVDEDVDDDVTDRWWAAAAVPASDQLQQLTLVVMRHDDDDDDDDDDSGGLVIGTAHPVTGGLWDVVIVLCPPISLCILSLSDRTDSSSFYTIYVPYNTRTL